MKFKFNTLPFTNIDTEDFIGRWEGEDYVIQRGEKRFFPSELSQHFAKQLTEKLFNKAIVSDSHLKTDVFKEKTMGLMLDEEMLTKQEEEVKTFKQQVEEHETQIKEMLAKEEREKKSRNIEALKIAENNVRPVSTKKPKEV